MRAAKIVSIRLIFIEIIADQKINSKKFAGNH